MICLSQLKNFGSIINSVLTKALGESYFNVNNFSKKLFKQFWASSQKLLKGLNVYLVDLEAFKTVLK